MRDLYDKTNGLAAAQAAQKKVPWVRLTIVPLAAAQAAQKGPVDCSNKIGLLAAAQAAQKLHVHHIDHSGGLAAAQAAQKVPADDDTEYPQVGCRPGSSENSRRTRLLAGAVGCRPGSSEIDGCTLERVL